VTSKKHMGSSIDDFLKEEGIFEAVQAQAVKEVVAWQLAEAMKKKKKISKNRMATLLKTSRSRCPACNGLPRSLAAELLLS
jgi:antitoxin HicB